MKSCICGETNYETLDMASVRVVETGAEVESSARWGKCVGCGVIRQLGFPHVSDEDFQRFYRENYPPVSDAYSVKDYDHDWALASKRMAAYKVTGGRTLDIGSGSGAFVDILRSYECEAYGCEICRYSYEKNSDFIYRQKFEDIGFPTDHFDLVTMHDVLEHSPDPVAMLREAFRITKQKGRMIIDYPNFFTEAGAHHWKDMEHIWVLTAQQLEKVILDAGFAIESVQRPVESKLVFYCVKPRLHRPRILLPPGIGDCYWPIVKLQAFLKREGLGIPDIIVAAREDKIYKSHLRAFPFIEMFPWLNASWEVAPFGDKGVWREGYVKAGRTIFKDILGCDWFISYNGILEAGLSMDQVDTDLECDWYPRRFVSLEEEGFEKECRERFGDYIASAYYFVGSYQTWAAEFGPEQVAQAMNQVLDKTGMTLVFGGGEWDLKDQGLNKLMSLVPHQNIIGQTSVAKLFGFLKGSRLVMGYPSGFTMMGPLLKKKTLSLWNDWHRYGFHWNTSPPDSKGKTYFIENTKGLQSDDLAKRVLDIVSDKPLAATRGYFRRVYGLEREQAAKSVQALNSIINGPVLDVSCGAGALVDECRAQGIDAWGCEEQEFDYRMEHEHIYRRQLLDVHFPTDHFGTVLVRDTFGHLMNPRAHLKEAFRVTKQEGTVILIQSPNKHMNVWYNNKPDRVLDMAKEVGFKLVEREVLPGKETQFILSKPRQQRPKVLLPPGIGDCYWSIIKLEALLKSRGQDVPADAYICTPKGSRETMKRSFPWLKMLPILHSMDQVISDQEVPGLRDIWKEAYFQSKRSVFTNVGGLYDYFVSWNGYLRDGYSLEKVDPQFPCDWYLPRFVSMEEERFRTECQKRFGDYILFYFLFRGTNKRTLKHFSVDDLERAINEIVSRTGYTPVFIGATWDREDHVLNDLKKRIKGHIDMVGRTDLEQAFGMMRGAKVQVGIPSGLSVVAPMIGAKTVTLWHDFFTTGEVDPRFALNVMPPDSLDRITHQVFADRHTGERLVDASVAMAKSEPLVVSPGHSRRPGMVYRVVGDSPEPYRDTVRTVFDNPPKSIPVKRPPVVATKPKPKPAPLPKPVPKMPTKPTTVVCVLKSGGDFDETYVANLRSMVAKNSTAPHKFVCLTDIKGMSIPGVEPIFLKNGFPGWWSKVEVFRSELYSTERIFYMDLDTLVIGNVDDIFSLDKMFYGLEPWNPANRSKGWVASGVMAWQNGQMDFVYEEFVRGMIKQYNGDQAYLSAVLTKHQVRFEKLQEHVPGIYSYKRQCRQGHPPDARIICFHGRPRVHECRDPWVREAWK